MRLCPDPRAITQLRAATVLAISFVTGAFAQDRTAPDPQKQKPAAEKTVDADVSRFCANVAPSIAEARIAWQTKKLADLDAQVRQRISDLEKAEASAREWIEKRDAMMKTATDGLVAIYSRMQPESAAQQIGAMDDQTAAAILARLKPAAAGAILDEMGAGQASRLAALLSAGVGKKS